MKKISTIVILIAVLMTVPIMSYGKSKVDVPETVKIKLDDGSIIELDLDEYLYGVVSSEMGTSYMSNGKKYEVGIEALKAQAIASRSYAVYNINHSKYDGYDLTSSTSDQVYKGSNVKDIVKQAVDATSGQVLTYDDEIIPAYFFSASGGHTESSEDVWSAKLPYARGVEDPYEPYIEGKSEWEVRIPASKYGDFKVLERSSNGRVTKLLIGGETYTKTNIRSKLGATLIKSTWFDLEFDEDSDEYIFTGKGYGHGVGMSQYGAMGMAKAGFSYEEILKWYYTDVEIVPDKSENIIIDEEEIENMAVDEYEIEEDNGSTKIVEKDYKENEPTIITQETKGPLLQKIISLIESWG